MKFAQKLQLASLILILLLSSCSSNSKNKSTKAPETNKKSELNAISNYLHENDALEIRLTMSENQVGAEIMYFMSGNKDIAIKYDMPLILTESASGKGMIYLEGEPVPGTEVYFYKNKATNKQIQILTQTWPDINGQNGNQSLSDGLLATTRHDDENWLGFYGVPAGIKFDLGEIIVVEEICIRFLQDVDNRIFLPVEILFSISEDDEYWVPYKNILNRESQEGSAVHIKEFSVAANGEKARYIKIEAKYPGPCPQWHVANNQGCFMFADEVVVE
ncbi:MAG: hypothetical protein U9R19_03795 [Bacteroidota bacterium]|nr:hypothetical protein [Bacteroidota bacterium]